MKNFLLFVFCLLMSGVAFGQTTIAHQSFEGLGSDNWSYTPNPTAGSFGSGDEWDVLTSLSNITNVPTDGTHFFGGVDINNGSNPNGSYGEIDFGTVSVLGYSSVAISFDYDVFGYDNGDDVDYTVTIDGVAQASVKLVDGAATVDGTETINIPDGSSSVSIIVKITQNGSDYFGVDNFKVVGTPTSSTPEANYAISSSSVTEGNSSSATHTVTVNMVPTPTSTIVLDLTVDGSSTATSTTDFTMPSDLTFNNGDASKTFDITVNGDTDLESDETVVVTLSLNSGTANIGTSDTYTLTITNDDFAPCTEPAAQPTILNLTPSVASIDGDFTAATADGYLVVLSTSSSLSSNPMDATTYSVGDALGGGTVVSASSSTTFTASSLTASTQYYFFVFAYNDQSCNDINYLTSTPLNGTTTTTAPVQVLISEVVDPKDNFNGRFVAIENRGASPADISGWKLKKYTNGSSSAGATATIPSSTTLASGDFYIIGKNDFSTVYGFAPDQASSSTVDGNGDDAYELTDASDNSVDFYGIKGEDGTGKNWEYEDAFVVRNSGVTSANSTFTIGEWTINNDYNIADIQALSAALPVELLHFNAKPQNQTTILTWSTASEENNAYFDVQRSTDGINFETIGQVEGAGTTYDVQEYSFIDESPVNGLNYYRLHQVDFDGQFENHKVVSVMMNGEQNNVQVYPNPTRGELNIVLPTIGENEIQIFDITGKMVHSFNTADEGMTTVNVTDLTNGQYIIKIRNANSISTALFVKNR
ncbi:MAG: lamin tail domain-containing protein [Saprospiraceae bacterium]